MNPTREVPDLGKDVASLIQLNLTAGTLVPIRCAGRVGGTGKNDAGGRVPTDSASATGRLLHVERLPQKEMSIRQRAGRPLQGPSDII